MNHITAQPKSKCSESLNDYQQIVRALEGDASLDDLNEGGKPGGQSSNLARGSSSDYDSSTYSADMRQFRKTALDSREYGASSEYGNTNEFDQRRN